MTQAELDALIEKLGSVDPIERREARHAIEMRGETAAGAAASALTNSDRAVRWEAAKALTKIASVEAVPALVDALDDSAPGVRWLAAEALVRVGDEAVVPVLRALITHSDDPWFRDGAHHVLQSLVRPETTEVVHSLEGRYQEISVPVAADKALRTLTE